MKLGCIRTLTAGENKINNWIEDLGNQEWVNYCVEMGFETYRAILGRICKTFRFGAYWMSTETINLAERLGAEFDLTVEPGFKLDKRSFHPELYTAPLPNYDNVSLEPYHPSRADFTKPDSNRKDGIWVIPMSTGLITYKFGRFETITKKLIAPDQLEPRPVTLNLARGNNGFCFVMENLLESLKRPYLAMVLRSDVCGECHSNPTDPGNMKENINYIMNHPLVNRFVFSTPQEAMTIMGCLEGQEVESRL